MNRGGINVGRRGNGSDPAVPQIGEQERFAADKNIEGASGTGFRIRPSGRRMAVAITDCKRVEKGFGVIPIAPSMFRSEEHTSELQSRRDLVCRLLLEKKNKKKK